MTSVAKASYNLQVAWAAINLGVAKFDTALFDSGLFGVAPYDQDFGGPYDNVSDRLIAANWTRGRDDTLTQMLATTGTIRLRDPEGLFDNRNTESPLFGQLDDRLHPVKLDALYNGARWPQFYGWARRIIHHPGNRTGYTELELVDLFYWLERVRPTIAETGATTTGNAINLVLDAVGWPTGTLHRDIDAGDAIPNFSASNQATGLEIIAALLNAERGVFFVAGAGVATFRSRTKRLTLTTLQTIENRMRAIQPGIDWDQVKNRVTVTRVATGNGNIAGGTGGVFVAGISTSTGGGVKTQAVADPILGGTPGDELYSVTRTDAASADKIGYSDLPGIVTPYLISDAQADDLADFVLSQVKDPRSPIYSTELDNRDADLLQGILDRDLVDRVTVRSRYKIGNPIPNPSLELDLYGWALNNASGTSVMTRDLAEHFLGVASLKLVGGTAGANDFALADVAFLPTIPGQKWTISGRFKCTAFTAGAVGNYGPRLVFWNLPGGFSMVPQEGDRYATITAVTGGWVSFEITGTAPADATNVYIRLYTPQGTVYYDTIQAEPTERATAYADGDQAGWRWEGVPHASRTVTGESGEFHIERVAHDLKFDGGYSHRAAWLLSEVSPFQAAEFDAARFDESIFVF